jgi:hypothetical protein
MPMLGPEAELERARLNEGLFGKSEDALTEADVIEKTYSLEEMAQSPELQRYYKSGLEDRALKSHRFRALTPELRGRYFGEQPNFAHWSALGYWTADEAALLTMELNPTAGLLSEVQTIGATLATSDPSFSVRKARDTLKRSRLMERGIDAMGSIPALMLEHYSESAPILRDYAFSSAAAEYIQFEERISRAIDTGKLNERIAPTEFVTWAKGNGIPVPEELARAIEARNKIPDVKAPLELNEALKREVDQPRRAREMNGKLDAFGLRERKSLLLIIGAMAKILGFSPTKRNKLSKQIEGKLLEHGINLTDETIYNHVDKGCEYLQKRSWDRDPPKSS